ncbi:MAG: hypothetical protein ABI690_08985 [Chloroflexota bacterium]
MVFNLEITPIVQNIFLPEALSWTEMLKTVQNTGKNWDDAPQFISIPAGKINPTYKYPVRMFYIQPQE